MYNDTTVLNSYSVSVCLCFTLSNLSFDSPASVQPSLHPLLSLYTSHTLSPHHDFLLSQSSHLSLLLQWTHLSLYLRVSSDNLSLLFLLPLARITALSSLICHFALSVHSLSLYDPVLPHLPSLPKLPPQSLHLICLLISFSICSCPTPLTILFHLPSHSPLQSPPPDPHALGGLPHLPHVFFPSSQSSSCPRLILFLQCHLPLDQLGCEHVQVGNEVGCI